MRRCILNKHLNELINPLEQLCYNMCVIMAQYHLDVSDGVTDVTDWSLADGYWKTIYGGCTNLLNELTTVVNKEYITIESNNDFFVNLDNFDNSNDSIKRIGIYKVYFGSLLENFDTEDNDEKRLVKVGEAIEHLKGAIKFCNEYKDMSVTKYKNVNCV